MAPLAASERRANDWVSGRGGDGDRGEHRPGRPAAAVVVLHAAAAGEEKIDPLGAVHRAAAAEPHDQVGPEAAGQRGAGIDLAGGRLFREGLEAGRLDPRRLERPGADGRVAGPHDARIADNQGSRRAELAGEFAQPPDGVSADDQPGGPAKFEGIGCHRTIVICHRTSHEPGRGHGRSLKGSPDSGKTGSEKNSIGSGWGRSVPRQLFAAILDRIGRLRQSPALCRSG